MTVLKGIENIVNKRPLIYLYDDVNQEILTPNKLLFGRNLEIVAPNDDIETEKDLSKRAKYTDNLLEHWWNRWHDEYLTELREYHKFKSGRRLVIPQVGDIVLGKDKNVRSASVLMKKSGKFLRRPVNKLYPIVQIKN